MDKTSKNLKKGNYKPLYLLAGFLLVFGAFIYLLIKPSAESLAIDELNHASTANEVQALWDKNKSELYDDQDFINELRDKMASFDLSPKEVGECLKWLPKPPVSLNVIIVPDLSSRINDEINNPEQVRNDTILLNEIWRSFESAARLKMNSNDRLMLDVTGGNQAQGQFRSIANDLVFDLSVFKNKSNKLYFEGKTEQFQSKVAELYQLAKQDPRGADYWSYFNHDLKRNLKYPTLYADYKNLLIILTDGYLEAQNKQATGTALYTGTYGERVKAFENLKAGQTMTDAISAITPIMDCSDHFPNLQVLVLEAHSRHLRSPLEPNDPGTARDFDILKKMWTDWFVKLEIKNASTDFFNERLNATDLTKQKIHDFIK